MLLCFNTILLFGGHSVSDAPFERHIHEDPHYPIIFHSNNLSLVNNDFITHWHDSPELLYFYSGSGVITLNTEQIRAQIGDVVVINSGTLHTVRSLTPSCSYYCLIAGSSYCEELGFEVEDILLRNVVHDPEVSSCFERIVWETQQQAPYYKAAVRAAVTELFLLLFRGYVAGRVTPPQKERGKTEMVRQAISYLRKHYQEEIAIEDLCERTGFSKYYFCRTFKEVTGLTPVDYLNTLRCEQARRLMLEGKSVGEAAGMTGFHNASYFSKVYQRHMGTLPSRKLGRD